MRLLGPFLGPFVAEVFLQPQRLAHGARDAGETQVGVGGGAALVDLTVEVAGDVHADLDQLTQHRGLLVFQAELRGGRGVGHEEQNIEQNRA